jgi:molecular chaperone GrpE
MSKKDTNSDKEKDIKENIDIEKNTDKIEDIKENDDIDKSTDNNETPEEQLEDMKKQYNTLNDKYLRAYADFENSKTRLEKDKYSAIDFAVEKFAKDLLEVVDTLTMALKSTDNNDAKVEDLLKNLTDGVELTNKKLVKVLEKHNVVKVESKGEFNPEIHQVISEISDTDKNSKEIVEVFQDGYKLNNRILRAAMVSVAK